MIGCTEYLEMMNAFMDGELDEESRAELSEHLRYCPGCFNASLAYKSINEAIADGETELLMRSCLCHEQDLRA